MSSPLKDTVDTGDGKAYNDYKGIEDDEDYEDYADSEYEERMTTWTSPSNMLQSSDTCFGEQDINWKDF